MLNYLKSWINSKILSYEFFNVFKEKVKFMKIKLNILKNKKEVVIELEEMSLNSYGKLIQNEISSRYNGMILETYGSKK